MSISPSPYIIGPAVRQTADFFGRAEQARQFYATLAGAQLQCVSVLGLRRAGKTSFLQYVAHPAVLRAHVPDAARYAMVYVDVSACDSPEAFYGRVYRQLLPLVSPETARRAVPQRADVYAVESLLYETGERRVVLMLDEFDRLHTADFGPAFPAELRALAGVWDYELAYVTASYWDLYRLGEFVGMPATSPFYNIFYPTPIYLAGLSPTELEELVRVPAGRVGVAVEDEDVAVVREVAGSLPFFVQATAAAWLGARARGRPLDRQELAQRLASEMGPYFEQWWHHFSDVEQDVLASVALGRPPDRLAYDAAEVERAVTRLRHYGLLVATGGDLWLDGQLFPLWLASRGARPRVAVRSGGDNGAKALPGEDERRQMLQVVRATGRRHARLAPDERGDEDTLCARFLAELGPAVTGESPGLVCRRPAGQEIVVCAGETAVMAAHCVTWQGQKALLAAVAHLLARQSPTQAALVVFARGRSFAAVVDAVARAMPHAPGFIAFDGRQDDGWLNFRLRGNAGEETRLAVMVFALSSA